ncbi:MAG: hypothetical protein AB1486_26695 [Planctomycetota bacterium]
MRLRIPLGGLTIFTLLVALASAETWLVSLDGLGDFAEITDALLSPSVEHGDVILVRPGTYDGFALTKGVIVRASATPFKLRYPAASSYTLLIQSIPEGRRAGVSGAEILDAGYRVPSVHVENCQGEVLLENIKFLPCGLYHWRLSIVNSENVALTGLSMEPYDHTGPEADYSILLIEHSNARMSDAVIEAPPMYG